MTAEECQKFADRCFEWAGQARHAEIRNVYFEMADRWKREAELAGAAPSLAPSAKELTEH